MNEELKQTIERVKQQNAHVLPITNMVQHVPSDIQRLIDAAEQVEAFKHDSDGALKMLGKEIVERTLLHRRLDAVAVEAAKAHVRVGELELALGLIEADNRDLEDAHRRIAELEAQLTIVSGLNEWHDLPELPPHVGAYLGFWKEDGAWVVEYWPSGMQDAQGKQGNWLTTPDGSIRPAPIAWRHLPAVPEKYTQQCEI